jgi:ABC-type bacteriocin/lantibiotic exporter with double-glycine peptidase domain
MKGNLKIRQQDEYDCGAASLCSVAAWYGVNVSLSEVRRACGCTREGITILGIIDGAKSLGLSGKAFKCSTSKEDSLKYLGDLHSPVIAHMQRNDGMFHFIVIYGVEKGKVTVMDPAGGEFKKYSADEFIKEWTGYVIFIVPGDNFEKRNQRENKYLRLFRILKFHKREIILALIGSIALTCIGVCNSLFLQQIIDKAIPHGNISLLMIISAAVVLLIPLALYIGYCRTIYLLRNGIKIDTGLIFSFLHKIFKLPSSFFGEHTSGDLNSRISDAFNIRTFISDGLVSIFVSILTFSAVVVLMFTFYWRLALFTLLFIPFYVVLYFVSDHINHKYSRDLAVRGAQFESDFIDSVEGAESVRHFGAASLSTIKTEESYSAMTEKIYRAGRAVSIFGEAGEGISKLLLATIIVVGGFAVFKQQMTVGELVSFYTLSAFFTAPMNNLVGMNSLINQALVSSERLFDITDLDEEKVAGSAEGNKEAGYKRVSLLENCSAERAGNIELSNLNFRYPGREKLFNEFSCVIPGGCITAIAGESGCGKSTLGSLLMRDLNPDSGKIFVNFKDRLSLDIQTIELAEWRRYISISAQRCHLFNATILDNITCGGDNPDIERVVQICAELGMENFVRALPSGLMTYVGERGKTLSGGEMQKISIARMLYRSSALYIFDEATSFMDEESENYVLRIMQDLRSAGRSVIMITHKSSNLKIADNVIRLS